VIIFYDKDGNIVGSIAGRIHNSEELNMWIGGDTTKRLVVEWKKVGNDYEPESQKAIFKKLEKNKFNIFDYKVKNKKLVKKLT
jgi:hypothetical protein